MNRNVVAVFGIAGSGKSTVCREAAHIRRGSWFSASGVLQSHARRLDSSPALSWTDRWAKGESAPDREVMPVLWNAYSELSRWPVLLDGYPRTLVQLEDYLGHGGRLDACVLLSVDNETALARISARARKSGRLDDDCTVAARRICRDKDILKILLSSDYIAGKLTAIDASQPADLLLGNFLEVMDDLTGR